MKHSLIIISFFIATQATAQHKLKPVSLDIFKNGTYFIVKEGTVPAPNGNFQLEIPKNPLLSTFWLTTTKDAKISRVNFEADTIKVSRECTNIESYYKENIGKSVTVSYLTTAEALKSFTGTLKDFEVSTGLLRIAGESSTLFVHNHKIVEFYVNSSSVKDHFMADSVFRTTTVHLNKNIESFPIKMTYMQSGISWLPSYNIKLIDTKTLQLEMKALIENFAEEIENTDLTLTVGAPQFRFGMQADPIAQPNYSSAGSYDYQWNPVSTIVPDQMMYQNIYSNATSPLTGGLFDLGGVPARYGDAVTESLPYDEFTSFETEGEKSNDLYRYELGKVTLPMNAKTSLSIFSSAIPYDDIYEVGIGDYVNYAANKSTAMSDENKKFDVYHSFELHNTTSYPFTTGACFVQDENLQPLAQDQVRYTPVNATVKVQLAKSPDVLVKNEEEELKKEDKVKKYHGTYYNRITITGTITAENLQTKSITLKVTKYVSGEILSASDEGAIKKPGKYEALNPFSRAEWTIKLDAGQSKKINYQYQVYVY